MQDDVKQWFQDVFAYRAMYRQSFLDAANQNDRDAVDMAKLLIQSLLLLHGGALIALPTFESLRPGPIRESLTLLLVIFSSGLIAALLAGLSAFFALVDRSEFYSSMTEAAHERGTAQAASIRFISTQDSSWGDLELKSNAIAVEIEKHADLQFARYLRLRSLGIFLVFFSIAGLVAASFVAVHSIGET